MTYNCPQCGLPRTGNQAVGLAMPQCLCSWQFTPPTPPATKREWRWLTGEDVEEIERWIEFKEEGSGRIPTEKLIRYIESKLKEKNNAS